MTRSIASESGSLTPPPTLPDKLYFSIGEVAELVQVAPHVLRYWEKEFSQIRPVKKAGNRRSYRRQDIDLLLTIRHLLYERRFTIPGAREHLRHTLKKDPVELLREIREELMVLRDVLAGA